MNRTSGRFPCHEYITCKFDAGRLGFDLSRYDSDSCPLLGNAIVAKVDPGSQAEREKVGVFDAVVMVNGEYLAFLTFEAITDRLRSAVRPLTVVFARPWKSAWERIGSEIDGCVRVGNLEKLSQGYGFISRWQEREFVLTRNTLCYGEDGITKRKIGLEEIIQIIPTLHDTEFGFVHQGREFKLKASNLEDKMCWLHALESTKKGCFDNVDKVFARLNLSMTSGATRASTQAPPPPVRKPVPVPPVQKGPYWLLNKSLVIIQIDSDPSEASVSLPPPVIIPRFQQLDLSVERQVLGS